MMTKTSTYRQPWLWVPSLYFAEGFPYVLVLSVSVIFFKKTGITNADIALFTSLLYLPWMIKPLWSPLVDITRTKRQWIVTTQLLVTGALFLLALLIAYNSTFGGLLVVFTFTALFSATHDIAADGFYMIGLTERHQAAFVGVRSMLYRMAMIVGQGVIVVFAGMLETTVGIHWGWSLTFLLAALLMGALSLYHRTILPFPLNDAASPPVSHYPLKEFLHTFGEFFGKKDIVLALLFLLFFRFAEALLVKIVPLFLLDTPEKGGLGLTTQEVGFVSGTVGIIALVGGGLLGGLVVAQQRLRRWLWPMTLMMHLPDIVYVYLSSSSKPTLPLITTALAVEQFGYGFGFTAYTLYMIYISEGKHKTSHYALCTGFMALSMIIPGALSGTLQEAIGYHHFFLVVLLATLPAFLITAFLRIPENFGRRPH